MTTGSEDFTSSCLAEGEDVLGYSVTHVGSQMARGQALVPPFHVIAE